jgi:hypothetical protein
LVCGIEGKTQTEAVGKSGTEEYIWVFDRGSQQRLEKIE